MMIEVVVGASACFITAYFGAKLALQHHDADKDLRRRGLGPPSGLPLPAAAMGDPEWCPPKWCSPEADDDEDGTDVVGAIRRLEVRVDALAEEARTARLLRRPLDTVLR